LEAGWFQRLRLPLPALLTIQSGINKPRYATLMGIKKAKNKPLERLTRPAVTPPSSPAYAVQAEGRHVADGKPAEQAAQLLKLREARSWSVLITESAHAREFHPMSWELAAGRELASGWGCRWAA
jgi:electron transfer flavoprotein alpha/beta subunit